MTQQEINIILKNHQHWLQEDCEGWEGMRANLCGANLCGANLCGADLCGAKNIPFIPFTCPDKGEFTGWKKM